jgi:hypothetical protein
LQRCDFRDRPVAEIVHAVGKFTSISGATTAVRYLHSEFVPTAVAANGHKLADLLFKVAALRLRSHVSDTVSFDQVGDALIPHNDSDESSSSADRTRAR